MKLSPAYRKVGVRRLAALAASTFLAIVPVLHAGPPATEEKTGTIKGRLVWAAGAAPEAKVEAGAANSKDPICKAKPIVSKEITVDPKTMGVADGFAYLVSPSGDYSATEKALLAKTPAVVVDQVGCEYIPYATVVHKDQKLTFKSSDPVGHNVDFHPFDGPAINPMLAPMGSIEYKIKKAEKRPTKAICSIHPWMIGWVFIADNPFAVVTKADGSFEITGIPPGEQHLIVWQSRSGYVTKGGNKGMAVMVKPGETTDVGVINITK